MTDVVSSRRRFRSITTIVGAGLVTLVVVMALVSFVWTPYDATHVDSGHTLLKAGQHGGWSFFRAW